MKSISPFECIRHLKQEQFQKWLSLNKNPLEQIEDFGGSSLLHTAADASNTFAMCKLLESTAIKTQEKRKAWLNKKDMQGFTCLHYAVFRANYQMAILLQKQGADVYERNKEGLTLLHIAAQGDSPLLICYYLERGMKIDTADFNGSNAFHWACYSNSPHVLRLLLAFNVEIDRPNCKTGLLFCVLGMTALHLAAMAGNVKIAKKLLIKGCDRLHCPQCRHIKDYEGRTALDIACENEFKDIEKMIIDSKGLKELFGLTTPYRKIQSKSMPFYLLIGMYVTNFLLNACFVYGTHSTERIELNVVYIITGKKYNKTGIATGAVYLCLLFKSSGFVESSPTSSYQLLQFMSADKICFDCRLIRPPRSFHCEICGRCVKVYDHHCPWVGKCIGANNYCVFFFFIICIFLFMTYTLVYQSINVTDIDFNNFDSLQIIRVFCIFFGFLCSGAFIIPLIFLIYTQTVNILTDQTTLERFSSQKKQTKSNITSKNIYNMCWGNKSLVQYCKGSIR